MSLERWRGLLTTLLEAGRRRTVRRPTPGSWGPVFTLALIPLAVGGALAVTRPASSIMPDVVANLIGGAIIGLVFAFVQYTVAQRSLLNDKDADLRLLLTSSSTLSGIDLSGRDLRTAYLYGKDLTAARLDGADFTGAVLDTAELLNARLSGAVLNQATLKGVQASGAQFFEAQLVEADLSKATLSKASLCCARLDGADFTRASLDGADVSRASLIGTVLDHADLREAWLSYAVGDSVRLARAKLSGAVLRFAELRSAHLARADLAGAVLLGADLSDSILIKADLSGVVAVGCNLARTDLRGCRLVKADLQSADLTGALLTGCDLRGANLTGAILRDVRNLDTAITDATTRWPEESPTPDGAEAESVAVTPATAIRRIKIVAADAQAAACARDIAAEIVAQQLAAQANAQGIDVSLPLDVRPPRTMVVRGPRAVRSGIPLRQRSTAVVTVRTGPAGGRVIEVTVEIRGRVFLRAQVPFDGRRELLYAGEPYPSAVDELTARILSVVDPRDGSPWLVRALLGAAAKAWQKDGPAATARCRQLLLAALRQDTRSPVVNYALGALGYNEYDAAETVKAIEYFTIARRSVDRLPEGGQDMVGWCLTGIALCNCQLSHRFGQETQSVVKAARNAAAMAVAVTGRPRGRSGSTAAVRRNAVRARALALYADAFAHHVTGEEGDVRASIGLYGEAIDLLRGVDLPVPAVLDNNLGYQYLTLAGIHERGPGKDLYEKAEKQFNNANEAGGKFYFGWANLGRLHNVLGVPEEAEHCYREALRIAGESGRRYPQGRNELACVLIGSGRDAEAWEAHELALDGETSPGVRARLRGQFAQVLLLVQKYAEAAEVAEKGLEDDPGNRICQEAFAEAKSPS